MAASSRNNIKRKNIDINRPEEKGISVNMVQQTNVEIITNDSLEGILERMSLFSERQKSRTWSVQAESIRRKIGERLLSTFENVDSEESDKVCQCKAREATRPSRSSKQNRDHARQGIEKPDRLELGLSENRYSVRKWENRSYQQNNLGSSQLKNAGSYLLKKPGSYHLRNPAFLKGFDSHDRSFRGTRGHVTTRRKNEISVKEYRVKGNRNLFSQTMKPQNTLAACYRLPDGKTKCNKIDSAGDRSFLHPELRSARVGSEKRFGCRTGERLETDAEGKSDGKHSLLHSRLANARVRGEKQLGYQAEEEPRASNSRRGSPAGKFSLPGNINRNLTFDLPSNIMSIQSRSSMASRHSSVMSFDNEPMSCESPMKEASPFPTRNSLGSSDRGSINSRSFRLVKQKAIDLSEDASFDSYFESCAHESEENENNLEFGARKMQHSLPQVIPKRPISCLPTVESTSTSFMSINSFSSVDNFMISSSSEDRRTGVLFGETITSNDGAYDVTSNESAELPCFVLSEYRSYVSVDEANSGDTLETTAVTTEVTTKDKQNGDKDEDLTNEDENATEVQPGNDENKSIGSKFEVTIEGERRGSVDRNIQRQQTQSKEEANEPSTSSAESGNEKQGSGCRTQLHPVMNLANRTGSKESGDLRTTGAHNYPPKRLSIPKLLKFAGNTLAEMPPRSCSCLPALEITDNASTVQKGLAVANKSFLHIPIDLSVGGLTAHGSNSNTVSFEYAFKKRKKFKIRSQEIDFES
eukprot:Seg3066.2 transcript_id=Seg3066.2/GoldUCD/mRNA.D3Y31 product="hypothetical protein" protein_id=Seg3066.2/GoldUCD/D3Y31